MTYELTDGEALLKAARERKMDDIDALYKKGATVFDAFLSIDWFNNSCTAKSMEILVCASPPPGLQQLESMAKRLRNSAGSSADVPTGNALERMLAMQRLVY